MSSLCNRFASWDTWLARTLAVGLAAAALLAPRPAGAIVRQPMFPDPIPVVASAAFAEAEAPEYLAFLVETPEGLCWVICRNGPVSRTDTLVCSAVLIVIGNECDLTEGGGFTGVCHEAAQSAEAPVDASYPFLCRRAARHP